MLIVTVRIALSLGFSLIEVIIIIISLIKMVVIVFISNIGLQDKLILVISVFLTIIKSLNCVGSFFESQLIFCSLLLLSE